MKKFIIKVLLFFAIIFCIDFFFGKTCDYLNSHAKGGDTKSAYYVANECNENILIFGSSRGLHHYVPDVLEDSLKMSAYNCSRDGNGILLMYSNLQMIVQRYTPKVIIYDISTFDIINEDLTKYLGWQKRFYNHSGISEVFDSIEVTSKFKMYSQLYKYSNDFIQILADNFQPTKKVLNGGYKPLYGTMNYEPKIIEEKSEPLEWNPTKKFFFDKFCKLCRKKDIKLFVTYSPIYKATSIEKYKYIIMYCQENDIPLLNHYTDTMLTTRRKYFKDRTHLNNEGAHIYTSIISKEIKKILQH